MVPANKTNQDLFTPVSVRQAKTRFSQLLKFVEEGGSVTIALRGQPVAELVRMHRNGLPFGIAHREPLVPTGDEVKSNFSA